MSTINYESCRLDAITRLADAANTTAGDVTPNTLATAANSLLEHIGQQGALEHRGKEEIMGTTEALGLVALTMAQRDGGPTSELEKKVYASRTVGYEAHPYNAALRRAAGHISGAFNNRRYNPHLAFNISQTLGSVIILGSENNIETARVNATAETFGAIALTIAQRQNDNSDEVQRLRADVARYAKARGADLSS